MLVTVYSTVRCTRRDFVHCAFEVDIVRLDVSEFIAIILQLKDKSGMCP